MLQLRHYVKKGKITVSEGTTGVVFNYTIDPVGLSCQCKRGAGFCPHLQYYLCDVLKIKKQLLPILTVPRVKANIHAKGDLETFCRKFLADEDEDQCVICHSSYLSVAAMSAWLSNDNPNPSLPAELYQCSCCLELIHMKCYTKWSATGRGCPRCKHGARRNQKGEGDWPSLS